MTLTELLTEVYNLTNRPDLTVLSTAAVKAATLKAHHLDFFSKDIFEQGFQFPALAFRHSFDIINYITNYRRLSYLKRVEDADDDVGKFFTIIVPDEVLDSYGINRTDIAYIAGRIIQIRSSVEFQFGLLGAYVSPIVTPDANYLSWVAEQFPYAIIYEAVRVITRATGSLEESNAFQKLLKRDPDDLSSPPGEYDLLLSSALSDEGQ